MITLHDGSSSENKMRPSEYHFTRFLACSHTISDDETHATCESVHHPLLWKGGGAHVRARSTPSAHQEHERRAKRKDERRAGCSIACGKGFQSMIYEWIASKCLINECITSRIDHPLTPMPCLSSYASMFSSIQALADDLRWGGDHTISISSMQLEHVVGYGQARMHDTG